MDSQTTFLKRFGDLVALLRSDPGNDAAQDLALTAVGAALAHGSIRVEVGRETSATPDALILRARLLARQVAAVEIAADADLSELLGLARALAHDTMPLPTNPPIVVITMPTPDTHGESDPPLSAPPSGPATRTRRDNIERRTGSDRRRQSMHPCWPGLERRWGSDRRVFG